MKTIWTEQLRHVSCIQDPPGVELYTITDHLKKGCVMLPVYKCARGATLLESFHLHLTRFVPGSSAGAVNFQAYMDGINRWNTARSEAAIKSPLTSETLQTFSTRLQTKVQARISYTVQAHPYTNTLLSVSVVSYFNCTTRIIVYFV